MYARDPGSAPQVNDRIPFVTIDVNEQEIINEKLDKIEKLLMNYILELNCNEKLKKLREDNIISKSKKYSLLIKKMIETKNDIKKNDLVNKYLKNKNYDDSLKLDIILKDINERIEYSIKLFLNKNLNNIFEKINKIN